MDQGLESKTWNHKFLEENINSKLIDIAFGNDFFGFDANGKGNKTKNKQMGLQKTKKLLHSKWNYQGN